ncbi:tetratricopeptide repeat protein [Umezawaea endophytica]|uniref:Tetratricopeptide repeat protein n=1 Tax=Umezawaea endophytica TaxID=1654476 RepID=A0A9X2VIW3_9PSEU|nr:tetratricopeptide repeat protein [Umezawaea endophytica]MCS7477438.1 tetratricopeptide repeat protein [Umezawaea endophytica]
MTLYREPDAINVLAWAQQRPADPPVSRLRLEEATEAVREGHEEVATSVLTKLVRGLTSAGLPKAVESRLASLALAASRRIRAETWTALALSRRQQGALTSAVHLFDTAYQAEPTAQRLAALAAVVNAVEGPEAAVAMVERGLLKWPGNPSLLAMAARLALDGGREEDANRLATEALAQDDEEPDALTVRTRLFLGSNDFSGAVDSARPIISRRPSLGRALIAIARHSAGSLEEDPGLVDAVIADLPEDTWVLTRFGEVLISIGRVRDAVTTLDKAVLFAPNAPAPAHLRGRAHVLLKDYAAAERDLAEAAKHSSADPLLTARQGEVALLRGNAATALEWFTSVDPDKAPGWMAVSLALAHDVLDHVAEARTAFKKVLERDPDNVTALLWLAEQALAEKPDGILTAEEAITRALREEPDNVRAHALSGEVHRRAGRHQHAVRAFDRALRIKPTYSDALVGRGRSLIALHDVERGVASLAEAAAHAPEDEWVLDQLFNTLTGHVWSDADTVVRTVLAKILDSGGDVRLIAERRARLAAEHRLWGEADALYAKARRLNALNPRLVHGHVDVLRALGHLDEALAVLGEHPDLLAVDKDLQWKRIDVLWRLERLREAQTELERLAQEADPPPVALAALGEVHRIQGDRGRARELAKAALDRDPDSAYVLAVMGTVELDDGHVDAARDLLDRAVAVDPHHGFAVSRLLVLEADHGTVESVRRLLGNAEHDGTADRDHYLNKAIGHYRLGEYASTLSALEESVAELGDDAETLTRIGWTQLVVGQSLRAAQTFSEAFKTATASVDLVKAITGLLAVDAWDEAVAAAAQLRSRGDGAAPAAMAMIWSHAGAWDAAAAHALDVQVTRAETAWLSIKSARMAGAHDLAVQRARQAHSRWPADLSITTELAECLMAVGEHGEATTSFEAVVDRLAGRVHLNALDLNLLGWCLMRTGRTEEAGSAFLRALGATHQTANVLLNLVLLSLARNDVRQVDMLVKRAVDELDRVTPAKKRGLVATALVELTTLEPHRDPATGAKAAMIGIQLRGILDGLDHVVEEAARALSLTGDDLEEGGGGAVDGGHGTTTTGHSPV